MADILEKDDSDLLEMLRAGGTVTIGSGYELRGDVKDKNKYIALFRENPRTDLVDLLYRHYHLSPEGLRDAKNKVAELIFLRTEVLLGLVCEGSRRDSTGRVIGYWVPHHRRGLSVYRVVHDFHHYRSDDEIYDTLESRGFIEKVGPFDRSYASTESGKALYDQIAHRLLQKRGYY